MTRIKICGVTDIDNALACVEAGADLIGLNFYQPSPRSIPVDRARELAAELRAVFGARCPLLVGVFVNEDAADIRRTADIVGLDAAQLSGDEAGDTLAALEGIGIKAIRPRSQGEALVYADTFAPHASRDERLPSLLVDAYHKALYGGTGEQASIAVALAVKGRTPRMMLAGGLGPDTVAPRVEAIRPWGVDVASGVEGDQPGIKDLAKVRALVAAVRTVDGVSIQ